MKSRNIKPNYARALTRNAIANGELSRPDTCELCGKTPKPIKAKTTDGKKITRPGIFAHHWNGYDNYLDCWMVCHRCNMLLSHCHNGALNKEQARYIVSLKDNTRRMAILLKIVPGYKARGILIRYARGLLDVSAEIEHIKSLA